MAGNILPHKKLKRRILDYRIKWFSCFCMPIRRLRLICPITNSKYIYRHKIVGNIKFLADNSGVEIGNPTGRKSQILSTQHHVVCGYAAVNINRVCFIERAYPCGFFVSTNNDSKRSPMRSARFTKFFD